MAYRYRFLSPDAFPTIHRTFRVAFADYYVDTDGISRKVLYNRAIKNNVRFDASVAAFDGERMVGFTLVGMDDWKGARAAFDIGTGVVPEHRGRGVAQGMFDAALPRLRRLGAERFVLEVIQENEPAIRVYRAAGFEVTRELDCFRWDLERSTSAVAFGAPVEVRPDGRNRLDEFEPHLEWRPSWENSFASIRRIPDEVSVFGAFLDGDCAGLLVYYPGTNWITTLVVKRNRRRRGIATALLEHFHRIRPGGRSHVRMVNVDHADTATLSLLEKVGCAPLVRQYEMELAL